MSVTAAKTESSVKAFPVGGEAEAVARFALAAVDWRNLGLIALAFGCVVALISPARNFPINDDWAYVRGVSNLLDLRYTWPDWAQASLVSQIAWGALFALWLGEGFTSATVSTLVLSLVALYCFYLLLRHLDVRPPYALFSTAGLGFNPIYFYSSYSFMSEVPFIAFTLAACLCYVRGLIKHGAYSMAWLWLGSIAAALALLTRQFGILIVVAAIVYLLLSRQWSWERVAGTALIPVLAFGGYALWEALQPTPLIAHAVAGVRAKMFSEPLGYMALRMQEVVISVAMPGLCLLPLLSRHFRPRVALIPVVAILPFQIRGLLLYGTLFPANGNVVAHNGFLQPYHPTPVLWGEWVWLLIGLGGALALALAFASVWDGVREWVREQKVTRLRSRDPAVLVYLMGALMFIAAVFLPPLLFDRYLLPALPAAMLFLTRRVQAQNGTRIVGWRWLLLAPLALFSVVALRDYMEHAQARWSLAESLASRGVPREHIDAGLEWYGWYLYEKGEQKVREEGDLQNVPFPPFAVLDPRYLISDMPVEGYREDEDPSFPQDGRYVSWLRGGEHRRLMVLKREE